MIAKTHKELDVYKKSFEVSMKIFNVSKRFPIEERYSLTDQIRRSSRSVCANLAEAFRKRRYPKVFVSKLSDCEAEAAETQVWLQFALSCNYIGENIFNELNNEVDNIIGKIVIMINNSDKWAV